MKQTSSQDPSRLQVHETNNIKQKQGNSKNDRFCYHYSTKHQLPVRDTTDVFKDEAYPQNQEQHRNTLVYTYISIWLDESILKLNRFLDCIMVHINL
jgi:hypothetical protein